MNVLIQYFSNLVAALLCMLLLAAGAWAQQVDSLGECGTLENPYGPFDYTNPVHRAEKLPRVEKAHFDVGVRNLQGHRAKVFTWNSLAGDIGYTLRAFPNHHGALYVMAQYYILGYDKFYPMQYTPECWFKRARKFKPSDGNIWLIEGIYEARRGRVEEAEKSYKAAIRLMPDAPEPHYNLGLLYIETKNYSLARKHAKRAYELGYPLPGLKNKLEKLGEWQE